MSQRKLAMTSETALAYEALINWELHGELPNQEAFEAACEQLIEHEGLAERYRKFLDECQHHENSRHSRPSSLQRWNEDDAPEENCV